MSEKVCPPCLQWADSSAETCPQCGYDFSKTESRVVRRELLFVSLFAVTLVLFMIVFLDQITRIEKFLLPAFITLTFAVVEGRVIIQNWPNRKENALSLTKRIRWIFAVFDPLMVCGVVWGVALFQSALETRSSISAISGLLMIAAGCVSGAIPGIMGFRHRLWPYTPRGKMLATMG